MCCSKSFVKNKENENQSFEKQTMPVRLLKSFFFFFY